MLTLRTDFEQFKSCGILNIVIVANIQLNPNAGDIQLQGGSLRITG